MNFEPLGDRVICRPIQIEKKTASGIILTGTTDSIEQRDTTYAKVVAVGEGKYFENGTLKPVKCKVDDVVVYRENIGLKFLSPEGAYDVLNEANILMIVRGEDVLESTENLHFETSKMFTEGRRLD